jgi:Ca2+-binding RTX toxin-like protein
MANITGTSGNDNLVGGALNDVINGLAGADTMTGLMGSDTYYVDNISDKVFEAAAEGIDTVISTVAFKNAIANVENYDFSKLAVGVNFTGTDDDNVIKGGAGIDTLAGGQGEDMYYVNSAKDVIVEAAFQGGDYIATGAFSVDLSKYANVENVYLLGAAALNATGTAINNYLFGNDGANILDGKGGVDFMAGGKGNDKYYVDNVSDQVVEKAGEGVDTVYSSVSYDLEAKAGNAENLVLTGNAGHGWGNGLNNTLTGNDAANDLDGRGGADTMIGGKGDDEYVVDHVGDKVIENAGEGIDSVDSSVNFTLGANVEHLSLENLAVKGTGNALNNLISGNDQNNIIDGALGADVMQGGKGNDTYYKDNLGDDIGESFGEGIDTVISTVAFKNAINNIENYDFSKLAVGVKFTGSDDSNVITGGAGIDTLAGGLGDDEYRVNSAKDVIVEAAFQGSDFIATGAFSVDLSKYANVENVRLLGATALNATGTAIKNYLLGNDGANILDGKGGDDYMAGGKGNDRYYADSASDEIVELAGQGQDTVHASVSFSLTTIQNVENVVLEGAAISASGNGLNNTLIGNDVANSLYGNGGADTMMGGKGDDFYAVEDLGDKVIENAGEGHDLVNSSVDFTLGANVEDLSLYGQAIKAIGNGLSNFIVGNDQSNIINGAAGADTMYGGKGNDTYYVDNVGDVVHDSEGVDTIVSSYAFKNALFAVENYDFSKVAVSVNFTGSDADNVIKGGSAVDKLTGGLGNDTYFVNSALDAIVEQSGLGTGNDTVATSAFSIDLSKYANVENATLLGTTALKLTGNSLNNKLVGNDGANILDGKSGSDTLVGGKGNDTYHVDLTDQLVENANEGIDTVVASINYTLGANIENLKLVTPSAGNPNLNGTGNGLNNVITGNAFDNVLDGKGGADTLTGGKGNDTYYVDNKGDKIVELAGEGHDTVIATVDFSLAALVNVEDLELDNLAVKGTGNSLANRIVGNWANNILNGGAGADTLEGSTGFDTYYVDNLKDLVIEDYNGGEGDTVYSTVALTHAYANVEHYDFSKATSAVNFTGSDDQNLIWSSQFADTLAGGKAADVYFINNTTDKVVELAGEGLDTVYATANVTKLWDNVERVFHKDQGSTLAWNATGNDLDNHMKGNAGNNVLNGGKGDDTIEGYGGNDTMAGGDGADTYLYISAGTSLTGNDLFADFDRDNDILVFQMSGDADKDGIWGEYEDVVAGITDFGAGKNVVVQLVNGGSLTFAGCGTGTVDHLSDLVADPATQLTIN